MAIDLSQSYFELFGIPESFEIDAETLAVRYRELQRATHPDRFAGASDQERRLAVQQASLVNEAFSTLKDPVSRARYLLEQRGMPIDDRDTSMDPGFLMEQMELRESLDSVRGSDDPFGRLDELRRGIERRERVLLDELRAALDHGEGDVPKQATESVRKLQFMRKLLHQVEDIEDELTHEI